MIEASAGIEAHYSFKPIDLDPAYPVDLMLDAVSSSDSLDIGPGMAPTEIFRESGDGVNIHAESSLPRFRRANPIDQRKVAAGEGEDMEECSYCRVISPYPFSHTSKEEIEEREQLTNAFDWTLETEPNDNCGMLNGWDTKCAVQVDYSRFFELLEAVNDQVMDECDDFSLSSHEANSLSDDLFFSDNPASFWEEGSGPILSNRGLSLTQVSLCPSM